MKKALAILFSLLLVWLQAVAVSALPVASGPRAPRARCCCGRTNCCVTPALPDSQPGPATPASASFQNQLSILVPAALVWTLSSVEAQTFSRAVSASLTATVVPLYTRHCARLL